MKVIKFIFLFAVSLPLFAQVKPTAVLATIGNKKITVREFEKRFELVPQVKTKGIVSDEDKKENLLYSIIAEKLWALAAEDAGYDTTKIMRETFKSIERMYIRDALYTKEIKSKVKVTSAEKKKAIKRRREVLKLKFIFSPNEKEIKKIYLSLRKGADFDKILGKRRESEMEKAFSKFTYGSANEDLENILFALKEGEYSQPIKIDNGWFIFKLYKKEAKKYATANAQKEDAKKALKILRSRKTEKLEREFFHKFFKNTKVSTDGKIFWSISNALIKILMDEKKANNIPDSEKVELQAEDYHKFVKLLGDTLNMEFVHFKKNPIKTDEFIRDFIFEGFYTVSLNPNAIRAKLNARVKRFITFELLMRQGEKLGLQNLPEVKEQIDMWRDNYLASLMKSNYLNKIKVTEQDARDYYEKHHGKIAGTKEVNIVEVLTDSLSVVEKVLNALQKGADLHDLAMKYTKRTWTKKYRGEFGFFPTSLYGKIGEQAAKMKIGEIAGPIKTRDGYSIFKLLAVKKSKSPLSGDFKDIKDEIIRRLKSERAEKELIKATVKFARRYGVKVNNQLLKNIKVKNYEMLVYKYFGFGGRLLAFPLTPNFYDWRYYWESVKGVLP